MSKRYEIKKSYAMIKFQTALVAIVALVLFLTTSQILRIMGSFIPANTTGLGVTIRLIILVIGVLSVLLTWIRAQRRKYFLEDGRIIIQNGGIIGNHSEEIITPQHASKLRLIRSSLGNKLGYGTVVVEVDSFSRKSVYELKNIVEPEKVIAELQARL